jgi:AcrR family transcriptional regulator
MAIELIIKYGFRNFTVEELAASLGISKKTVYKHFSNKQEIISTAIDAYMDIESSKTRQALSSEGSWLEKIEMLCSLESGRKINMALLAELSKFYPAEWVKVEQIRATKGQSFLKLLDEGVAVGDIPRDINLSMVVLILEKTMDAVLNYDFLSQNDLTINHAIQQINQIVFYGILTRDLGK